MAWSCAICGGKKMEMSPEPFTYQCSNCGRPAGKSAYGTPSSVTAREKSGTLENPFRDNKDIRILQLEAELQDVNEKLEKLREEKAKIDAIKPPPPASRPNVIAGNKEIFPDVASRQLLRTRPWGRPLNDEMLLSPKRAVSAFMSIVIVATTITAIIMCTIFVINAMGGK